MRLGRAGLRAAHERGAQLRGGGTRDKHGGDRGAIRDPAARHHRGWISRPPRCGVRRGRTVRDLEHVAERVARHRPSSRASRADEFLWTAESESVNQQHRR
jgi:hypothetical protein